MPKHVVSKTLKNPQWGNTTVLVGDVVREVSQLKEQPGGDLLVNGSCDLVHTLIAGQISLRPNLQVT